MFSRLNFKPEKTMSNLDECRDLLAFWLMEDNLNFLENERRPQPFGKWKMTSILKNLPGNVDQVTLLEYNMILLGRQPQLFG